VDVAAGASGGIVSNCLIEDDIHVAPFPDPDARPDHEREEFMVPPTGSRGASFVRALAAGLLTVPGLACFPEGPLPAAKAAQVERAECGAPFDEASAQRLLKTIAVAATAPKYMPMFSSRLAGGVLVTGVRILIRPPEGLSTGQVERLLQCHCARAVLFQVDESQLTDDPFWLPDDWVDISVVEKEGDYLVTVEGTNVQHNIDVYERAKTFARAHAALGDTRSSLPGYLNWDSDRYR
jgi:hypothetical protein